MASEDDDDESVPGASSDKPGSERGSKPANMYVRDALRRLAGPDWQAHFANSQRIADQLRGITAVSDHFSATSRLVSEMQKVTAASDGLAKIARIGWPNGVSEALLHGLRPSSAVTEALKLQATTGALEHLKQVGLDAGQFIAASRLAKDMQASGALAAAARMALPSFESGIAAELRRLQENMAVFRPDPNLARIASDFSASLAPYQSQFQAISRAIESATAALRPQGEMLLRLAEEQRVAQFILELGFVPHGELWEHISEIERPDGADLADFSERLIGEIWPELAMKLALEMPNCMNDAKLHAIYAQMLAAHEAGLHEMVLNSVPTVLERAVSLARGPGEKMRTFEWLETEVSELPINLAGGYRGYRVWKILIDHTFAGCWTDAEADASKYPNRHAAAHGKGTRAASRVDSLNAILLTHFVITTAKAIRDYKGAEAA